MSVNNTTSQVCTVCVKSPINVNVSFTVKLICWPLEANAVSKYGLFFIKTDIDRQYSIALQSQRTLDAINA